MYKDLLISDRRRPSKVLPTRIEEAISSDRSRIIYSSPFRRLQSKAQVFSLESNAAVRSRLTHTLEVADVGKLIAQKVVLKLALENDLSMAFINTVEVACLAHDIGNPPFGHFCEAAIQDWFKKNWEELYQESCKNPSADRIKKLRDSWIKDFENFDGNPQGIRILLSLQEKPGSGGDNGLNLTYTSILACLKYITSPEGLVPNNPLKKKAGYFITEEGKITEVRKKLNRNPDQRFPLTYIMEAADDISYCASDIEDGIEKNIISAEHFFSRIDKKTFKTEIDKVKKILDRKKLNNDYAEFLEFKIQLSRNLIKEASEIYYIKHDEFIYGKINEIFDEHSLGKKKLDELKKYAKQYLFRSVQAEDNEIAGYSIIIGILNHLKPLFSCSKEKFSLLMESIEAPDKIKGQALDIHWRYFNKLPQKYKDVYNKSIEDNKDDDYEWFCRAHLITDYISGMTDNFALEIFQLFSGIKTR